MTLGDVAAQLKYGELRAVVIKDDMMAITSYVNLALIALYSRFVISTQEVLIPLKDNKAYYTLPSDVMLIDSIYDENGDSFDINNPNNLFGVMQTSYNTLQVGNPCTGATLGVVYRNAPEYLVYIDESSLLLPIPVPAQLLEPLLHYVGYRAHGSINGDIKEENNTHLMRYEASCLRIEQLGLIRKDVPGLEVSLAEGISESGSYFEEVNLNNNK